MRSVSKALTAAMCSATTVGGAEITWLVMAVTPFFFGLAVRPVATTIAPPIAGESRPDLPLDSPIGETPNWGRDLDPPHRRLLSSHVPERQDDSPLPRAR